MCRLSWNALEFTALFWWGNRTIFLYNKQNNIYMDVWKYEIISRDEQDISLVRFAHSWDILVNTRNKFHISAHPYIFLYIFAIASVEQSILRVIE